MARDPEQNHFPEITATYGPIPMTQGWQDYCKELVTAGKAWQSRTAGVPAKRELIAAVVRSAGL